MGQTSTKNSLLSCERLGFANLPSLLQKLTEFPSEILFTFSKKGKDLI